MITYQDKNPESKEFGTRIDESGALCSTNNTSRPWHVWYKVSVFKDLKECLLIQKIQLKKHPGKFYTKTLTPKRRQILKSENSLTNTDLFCFVFNSFICSKCYRHGDVTRRFVSSKRLA